MKNADYTLTNSLNYKERNITEFFGRLNNQVDKNNCSFNRRIPAQVRICVTARWMAFLVRPVWHKLYGGIIKTQKVRTSAINFWKIIQNPIAIAHFTTMLGRRRLGRTRRSITGAIIVPQSSVEAERNSPSYQKILDIVHADFITKKDLVNLVENSINPCLEALTHDTMPLTRKHKRIKTELMHDMDQNPNVGVILDNPDCQMHLFCCHSGLPLPPLEVFNVNSTPDDDSMDFLFQMDFP